MILFFNILAWGYLGLFGLGLVSRLLLKKAGYEELGSLRPWVLPALFVALAWIVSGALT